MQCMLTMHSPIYEKNSSRQIYILERVIKINACVHPNAPCKQIWTSILKAASNPAVIFVAGEKNTFCNLNDGIDVAREVIGMDFASQFNTVWKRSNHGENGLSFQDESAMVYCVNGLIQTLPLPDMARSFPQIIQASDIKKRLQMTAQMQQSIYKRLQHNVQFVDLNNKTVVKSIRFENGTVQTKRKRNACSISQCEMIVQEQSDNKQSRN